MTLAWDRLLELDAYRVTEIPRRPDAGTSEAPQERPSDTGRTQRFAALVAAYHAGAETKNGSMGALAIGWIRHSAGGPIQFVVAGAGLVGSGANGEVFLTLPGGARAQPLPRRSLATLVAQLPSWRAIGGISDGLLPDHERRTGDRPPPSMEECLLAVWPGPFGMLLLAEPLGAAQIRELADELAEREREATGISDRFPDRAVTARRLHLRHAEVRKGASTGLWRVRLLAGGSDPDVASRVAGLVCASADLAELPYAIAPASQAPASLPELLADQGPASPGVDAAFDTSFHASTELVAALSRPPEREVPGVRLALRPDFDVTPEQTAGSAAITVGEVLDSGQRPAGPFVLPLDSLNRHVFVCGATGSGKSQTVRTLLEAATGAGIPWLVVEPAKAEYRLMAARLAGIAGPGAEAVEVVRIRPGESRRGRGRAQPAGTGTGHTGPPVSAADPRGSRQGAVHRVLPFG